MSEIRQGAGTQRKKTKWDLSLGLSPEGGRCELPNLSIELEVSESSSAAISSMNSVGSPAVPYLESVSVESFIRGRLQM